MLITLVLGYIQPDEYLIQYREVKNDSFIKDWVQAHTVTREDGLVQASIDIKPEVEYQLRIVSVATISGVKHTNSSQVIKIDAVQCQGRQLDYMTVQVCQMKCGMTCVK